MFPLRCPKAAFTTIPLHGAIPQREDVPVFIIL